MSHDAQPAHAGTSEPPRGAKLAFSKPHLEPHDLMRKLMDQGMSIDETSALPYLRQVGGYRMKGYWYQWQDSRTKKFRHGAHFDHVIRRYEFDRELRRATADALERIELTVRTVISNVLSKHEGPHWFMKARIFKESRPRGTGSNLARPGQRKPLLDKVREEVERMRDRSVFITHYLATYDNPALPPSWAISECLTFGSWSQAYRDLANTGYRKEISRRFKVEDPAVFVTWLHAFSVLRNLVAHHNRLIGIQSSVTPGDYRKAGLTFGKSRTFFVSATVIHYVCGSIKRGPDWRDSLEALFARYDDLNIEDLLGFPMDWRKRPGWSSRANRPPISTG